MNNYCKNVMEVNGMKLMLKNFSMVIMMSIIVMGSSVMVVDSNEKIVIVYRGVSGYLLEYMLLVKVMVYV